MFTGIIQEMGTVRRSGRHGGYLRLEIAYDGAKGALRPGDSMAVNGVCLTAVTVGKGLFGADLSAETQTHTTLGELRPGDKVNLERPVSATDPLGGHIVLGHADGAGRVSRVTPTSGGLRIAIEAPREVMDYLVSKGSVAVDGVSLTVGDLGRKSFEIFLIPETQGRTTLSAKKVGAKVNLEADYVAKLVRKFIGRERPLPGGSFAGITGEE